MCLSSCVFQRKLVVCFELDEGFVFRFILIFGNNVFTFKASTHSYSDHMYALFVQLGVSMGLQYVPEQPCLALCV